MALWLSLSLLDPTSTIVQMGSVVTMVRGVGAGRSQPDLEGFLLHDVRASRHLNLHMTHIDSSLSAILKSERG